MTQPSSLLIVDADLHGLETLTYGFEREGCKVTRTSDLSRAVQLSRTGSPGLAAVMVREPAQPALDVIAALHGVHREKPSFQILALGDAAHAAPARVAGAADFLRTPTYIRDVVNVAKLCSYGDDGEGLLSEYHGLFYLLRAMAATGRSCVLRLARGSQRAEIRFKDGKVTSANVRSLQNLPALHHMLLWEEARVSIASGPVAKPNQFPLSSQEVLDECERFMRDFAHAARDLGPPSTIYRPCDEPRPEIAGMQPNQMVPLLRLFDGRRGLADVVEESPFRIFDTIRMIRRLVEGGVLTTRTARRPSGPQQRISRPVAPLNGTRSTGPQSMLGQWAMVPDQRGVVGDRRSPSRPLMPFGQRSFDQPGMGGDRRKQQSRPVKPFATPGPTPLPTTPLPTPAPAPIPLTQKKVPSGDVVAVKGELGQIAQIGASDSASGEIPPVKRRPTPDAQMAIGLEPTVQVKLDTDGTPLELPPVRAPEAPAAPAVISEPPVRRKTPTPSPLVRQKTPIPTRVTPAAAFDAVEADFFAREADLYKREAVETFDDLDPMGGGGGESRATGTTRRKRK